MSQEPDFDFDMIGRQIKDTGKQIKDTVKSAIHSPEFNDLGQTICSMAQDVQTAFKSAFQAPAASPQAAPPAAPPHPAAPVSPAPSRPAAVPPRAYPAGRARVPGGAGGVLLTVFGGIGLGLSLTLQMLVLFIAMLENDFEEMAGACTLGFLLPLFAISVVLLLAGGRMRARTRRYRRIIAELGSCSFCPVELLASHTGQTARKTVRDLRRMIALGLLPEARLVDEESCLILNPETYKHYQQAKQREEEEKRKAAEAAESGSAASLIFEGRALLRQIGACRSTISDGEISQKLIEMETTSEAIFRYVEEHPDKLPEIRRFLQYYLPTTLKLLEAYRKFHDQPVQSEQQKETQKQIESTLDTINQAFLRLLDSLMQTERMNVSADISVMKTMLEREGLSGSPMSGPKPEGDLKI